MLGDSIKSISILPLLFSSTIFFPIPLLINDYVSVIGKYTFQLHSQINDIDKELKIQSKPAWLHALNEVVD